jgi:CRISPR-associated protein Cas2
VFVLERVPASLRGELTRWLIEPKAGVFVGSVPASVRDKLWDKACGAARGGACLMVCSSDGEQGYRVRAFGRGSREIVDMEGLQLVRMPSNP